jgi:hypothetical protein
MAEYRSIAFRARAVISIREVAQREGVSEDDIRREIARGRIATADLPDGEMGVVVPADGSLGPTDLILMAEYSADPVWSAAHDSMLQLEWLPISAGLRSRLNDWARRCERFVWQQIDHVETDAGIFETPRDPVDPPAPGTDEQLDREGRALCQELRQQLGSDWRVAYAPFPGGRPLQWE